MVGGVTSLLQIPLAAWQATGREPVAGQEILSGRYACYNLYQASDGRWLAVGALEPKFWAELCTRLGCPELIARQFEERQDELKARIGAIFRPKPPPPWSQQFPEPDSY